MVAICSGSSYICIVPFRYTSPNAHIFDFLDVHPVVFSINVISKVAVLILYHYMILRELTRLQSLKQVTH